MSKIYLDYCASTPVDPQVLKKMMPYFSEVYGNPSSLHQAGRASRTAIENARLIIAKQIGAKESEIHFVSGGTEADNLAIIGTALQNREKGNHIITSKIEHKAVINACKHLETQGFSVSYLSPDKYGQISVEAVTNEIRPETILISLIHGNNEVGTLNPIKEIGAITKQKGIFLHTDAVQSFGKLAINVNALNVDLLSLSSHKIYGPKGIGAVYINRKVPILPMIHGGAHEHNKRAGTEYLPGIVGFAEAAEMICADLEANETQIGGLTDYFKTQIFANIDRVQQNGHPEDHLYNVLNISFLGCASDMLMLHLDMKGIAVSTGSACNTGKVKASHVLTEMKLPQAISTSAIRFSLGKNTTKVMIDETVEALKTAVQQIRRK